MPSHLKSSDTNQLSFDFLSFAFPPAIAVPPLIAGAPPEWQTPTLRSVIVGSERISYQLSRSKRRSIGLVIDSGALRVVAPRASSISAIEGVIREKARWIHKKLAEQRAISAGLSWLAGSTIPFLGKPLVLSLQEVITPQIMGEEGGVVVMDERLIVDLPPLADARQIKDRTQAWLQQRAKQIFAEKLEALLNRLDITIKGFELTAARTYWGVCTPDRRIRLNWRLIHLADELIDYVIAHEVAHLFEMNHSPRFWHTVAQLDPNYIEHRAALKKIRIAAYE